MKIMLPGTASRHRRGQSGKISAIVLAVLLVLAPLAACSDAEPTEMKIADYGDYGSNLANKIASDFPFRSPGSEDEWRTGDLIIKSLKELGYQPIVTEFTFVDSEGALKKSRNIAVLIKGSGFETVGEEDAAQEIELQVIIGAHYDTPVSAGAAEPVAEDSTADVAEETTETDMTDEPDFQDYDGIHDNAAGIGVLLTAAREMQQIHYGYDVVLIAFGAGSSGQAGARYYASQMSKSDIAATDAMYCIDSIYAGDKVYAHAGSNSVRSGIRKDYDMRRKLYEATDVFYEYQLYTNNGFMLYTNMSSVNVTVEGMYNPVIYREWTLNESDYLPFDKLGIPIVFFESYNYDEDTLEAMKESKNPAFTSTGGMIRGTYFDTAVYLKEILNTRTSAVSSSNKKAAIDQLTRRINNIAFILTEAVRRGPADTTIR